MRRSMPLILLAVLVAGGCSQAEEKAAPAAVSASGVAGLYERAGRTGGPDRLCLSGQGDDLRFGLVTGSDGPGNCTARGTAVRRGTTLRLRIDGAPACTLAWTVTEAGVTLDAAQGAECDYYCGEGAVLTPGLFAKAGASEEVGKAVDIAGEPLCR